MSEHVGYICKINELRPHSNADRLQIATIFSQNVIVDLSVKVGDIGVFFPIDLQLSEEYCTQNNLVRKKDENGNNIGGYLDENKRNIRAMKLRGERSEGLFMPLESLAYTGETKFEIGNKIDVLNGHEICCKYIPNVQNRQGHVSKGNRTRKHHVPIAPLFAEHVDTEQLAYNMDAFKPGDQIEITLKLHGTSGRTGYLPKLQGYKRTFWDKIFHREGTPIYDWGYVTGTRRVVINDFNDGGGFYGDNAFREPHAHFFEGKLHASETVYYEIVGYTDSGVPIMPSASNKKIGDKDFLRTYGETTEFSYGCKPGESQMYVYRMTSTNNEGDVVEYSPDFMRYRCEQMGVKCVPVMWKGYIPHAANDEGLVQSEDFLTNDKGEFSEWILKTPGEYIKDIAEQFYDGPDPIGKTHVREGVVIRIVNRPKFCAYKHKNFSFKVLSGIAADLANTENMSDDILSEL